MKIKRYSLLGSLWGISSYITVEVCLYIFGRPFNSLKITFIQIVFWLVIGALIGFVYGKIKGAGVKNKSLVPVPPQKMYWLKWGQMTASIVFLICLGMVFSLMGVVFIGAVVFNDSGVEMADIISMVIRMVTEKLIPGFFIATITYTVLGALIGMSAGWIYGKVKERNKAV